MNNKVSHLLGHYITTTARTMHRALQQNFRKAGYPITSEQWVVLVWLFDQDGRTQQELCDLAFKDKPSITRIISNLEKSKLVTRVDDAIDRRAKRIFLTEKCKNMEQQLLQLAGETQTRAIKGISAGDIENCTKLLQKINKNLH